MVFQISVSWYISIYLHDPPVLQCATQHATWRPCFNDLRSGHQAPALPHLLLMNMLCSSHTFVIIIINIIIMHLAPFQIPRTHRRNHRHSGEKEEKKKEQTNRGPHLIQDIEMKSFKRNNWMIVFFFLLIHTVIVEINESRKWAKVFRQNTDC